MQKNEPLTRTHILQVLADRLDDQTIRHLFPEQSTESIRLALKEVCDRRQPVASPPPIIAAALPKEKNQSTRCRLFTDGASRGNPGLAGAGIVLFAENGEEIATKSVYLGECTNNVAEYKALIIGLQEALRHRCTTLALALDSELIVRQIQGRYKVKNEFLLPLFNEARVLLAQLGHWSISHVPRADNARADQLANQGIDQRNDL